MDAHALAAGSEQIPFNAMIGVKAKVAEPGHFEVLLPERPDLLNHMGAIHAVPIVAPAEYASGAAVSTAIGDLVEQGLVPIAKSLRVRYRKPAMGDLLAVARVDDEQMAQVRADALATGRVDFEVPVAVQNAAGDTVAEVVVEWAIRKMG
jgi:acyl-coenzyme A thioesterase PaaI-like protein